MGCYATLVTNVQHPDFNYRTSLSIWFRQLFMLKPDASLMSGVPIAFKMHILLGFHYYGLLAIYTFGACLSTLTYINRRYIIYRKNKSKYKR